jgi:hypothetical protein
VAEIATRIVPSNKTTPSCADVSIRPNANWRDVPRNLTPTGADGTIIVLDWDPVNVQQMEVLKDFFRRIAAIAATHVPAAGMRSTPGRLQNLVFDGGMMGIPSGWKKISAGNKDPFVTRSPDSKIQATISVMNTRRRAAEPLSKDDFQRIAAMRAQAERRASSPDAAIGTPYIVELSDGTVIATFEGQDPPDKLTKTRMATRNGTLVTVYLEMIGDRKPRLDSLSRDMFASISIQGN